MAFSTTVTSNTPIPPPPIGEGADFFEALQNILSEGLGQQGDPDKRFITVNDLTNSELIKYLNSQPVSVTRPDAAWQSNGITTDNVPDPPRNLQILNDADAGRLGAFSNHLSWENPVNAIDDISAIQIWISETINRSDATLKGIVTYPGTEYVHAHTNPTTTYYYWIRAVNWADQYSVWEPSSDQGGLVVTGYESINTTIEAVMKTLKGEEPTAYDAGTTYEVGEHCSYTVGNDIRRYNCILQSLNHLPTNTTYWERLGILVQGEVDGISTLGVDGNMVVDGTIITRNLHAGCVTATEIAAGTITASEIAAGTITSTEIQAGSLVLTTDASDYALSSIAGDLDDVSDGASYGRIGKTFITGGKLIITAGGTQGISGTLPVANSEAKCTDAAADETSANTAANITDQGDLATNDTLGTLNSIYNGGFRNDLTHWTQQDVNGTNFWGVLHSNATYTLQDGDSPTGFGSTAYIYTTTASSGSQGANLYSTYCNVIPGRTYTLRFLGGNQRFSNTSCRAVVWLYNKDNTYQRSVNSDYVTTVKSGGSAYSDFQVVNTTFTTAAIEAKVRVCFVTSGGYASGDSAWFWIDQVVLCEGDASPQWNALANNILNWEHSSDTTKINGGNIYTNTVTATQINVSTLSALTANLGTITAGIAQSSDGKFKIDFTNKWLKVWDASSVLRLQIGYIA